MSEPIELSRELDKAEVGDREFLVSGADAPVALDATEEVFDSMTAAVEAS
jgi:hypothetical protein